RQAGPARRRARQPVVRGALVAGPHAGRAAPAHRAARGRPRPPRPRAPPPPPREAGPGRYPTERPVPVTGNWKTMLRLAKGTHLMALPVYLPPSPQADRTGVPGRPRAGLMQADTFILQREARGGPAWLTTTAYAVLGIVVAVWLGLPGWGPRPPRPPR